MRHLRDTLDACVLILWIFAGGALRADTGDPGALWGIVHDQCLPHLQQQRNPAPCESVTLQDGEVNGFAILKDLRGAAQFLLIPTVHISGIESAQLLLLSGGLVIMLK